MAGAVESVETVGPSAVFRRWARAARGTAARCAGQRDSYGARLASARAKVYDQAAALVGELGATSDAASRLLDNASRLVVPAPPLSAFDEAGIRYCAARAWQCCAWQLDPGLPEVQPPW